MEIDSTSSNSLKRSSSPENNDNRNGAKRLRVKESIEEEVKCIVCREIPCDEIFNCTNEHLMCKICHDQVMKSEKPTCPMCREDFKTNAARRNKSVEKVIRLFEFPCAHDGCSEICTSANVVNHRDELCQYRIIDACRFSILGCTVKQLPFHAMSKHESFECNYKMNDSAFDLTRVVVNDHLEKEKKLNEAVDEMTRNYNELGQEYNVLEKNFKFLTLINEFFNQTVASANLKAFEIKNIVFDKMVKFTDVQNGQNLIYAVPSNDRISAVGLSWNIKLLVVLKNDEFGEKCLEKVYLSLAINGQRENPDATLIYCNFLNLIGHKFRIPTPAHLKGENYNLQGISMSSLTKIENSDTNKIIPWKRLEKQRVRIFPISNSWDSEEKVQFLQDWNDSSIVPALRMVFANCSESMKPDTGLSSVLTDRVMVD